MLEKVWTWLRVRLIALHYRPRKVLTIVAVLIAILIFFTLIPEAQ